MDGLPGLSHGCSIRKLVVSTHLCSHSIANQRSKPESCNPEPLPNWSYSPPSCQRFGESSPSSPLPAYHPDLHHRDLSKAQHGRICHLLGKNPWLLNVSELNPNPRGLEGQSSPPTVSMHISTHVHTHIHALTRTHTCTRAHTSRDLTSSLNDNNNTYNS